MLPSPARAVTVLPETNVLPNTMLAMARCGLYAAISSNPSPLKSPNTVWATMESDPKIRATVPYGGPAKLPSRSVDPLEPDANRSDTPSPLTSPLESDSMVKSAMLTSATSVHCPSLLLVST
jgi:hypothetical protein